jgi:arabinan endo-1,5-alpha-L-arabinosidase
MWMHYGSYFGGLYCVQLNPETGLTQVDGDHGHLVATRANRRYKIIEAPEIIYHPELKQYYLFVSYEPLFTYYNVRVGRSDNPEGPFYDFFGNNMADTTNNYPILTHSYLFNNHPGWSGNGHCAVINDDGRFYMLHQGRLAPDNLMMVMHVRQMMFLPSGWPVVAPERYAGLQNKSLSEKELSGEWEIITLNDLEEQTTLEQGQIPPGGWTYKPEAFNRSVKLVINNDGTTSDKAFNRWSYDGNFLTLGETTCALFYGWDWENQEPTIQFSGILDNGSSIWGKKITNNLK